MACICTVKHPKSHNREIFCLLAKTRRCLSLTLKCVCVFFFVLSSCGYKTAASTTSYSCPVELKVNHTSHCECNVLLEIHCYNLDEIPEFLPDDREFTALYIDNQDIKHVLSTAFFFLQVRKLSLNNNPFGDAISVNALSGLERVLEELHLADCGIKILPMNLLLSMNRLKLLHLWGNQIERIPDKFFSATNQLRELSLWGNQIKQLNSNTFAGLWELRKLDLDNNRISRLNEDIFRHLGKLEALYLGGNNINTINSDTFKHTSSLKVLKLNNNGLEYTYENTFRGLKNLQVLHLQNNLLNVIHDDIFKRLSNLTILLLQHNKLQFMWGKNFENLRKLREIHLSYNLLPKLNDRLFRGSNELTHLFVDHNELTTLRKCTFPRKPRLKILSVVGNPIQCDCRLHWIVNLQEKTSVWGNCLPQNTPAETLTSITDRQNYRSCTNDSDDCPRQ